MTARRPTPADFAPPRPSRVRAVVEVVVVAVAIVAAFVLGVSLGSWQPSQCSASEDSCEPRYVDGRWELVVVIP